MHEIFVHRVLVVDVAVERFLVASSDHTYKFVFIIKTIRRIERYTYHRL